MSDQLKGFLKSLNEDPEKRARFQDDPDGTMEAHGLSDEQKTLVKSGDKKKIQDVAGLEDAETRFLIV